MSKSSKDLLNAREAVLAEIEKLANKANAEGRELTVEEVSMRDEFAAQAGKLQARAVSAKASEKSAKVAKAAESRKETATSEVAANDLGGNVVVKSSERTYTRGGQHNYLADVTKAAGLRDAGASARLARHAQEVSVDAEAARQRINAGSARAMDAYFVKQARAAMAEGGASEFQARSGDLSTTNGVGGEFVPPAYLTEQYVAYARSGRVFADSVTKQDLPAGTMSINIPKVTGGTSIATQATQNTAVSDTAATTTFVTVPVVTVAGQQTVSLQLLERSPIAMDDVLFKDLTAALASQVDIKCLNGPGSGDVTGALNTSGITSTTWTSGSPTLGGFYGQIAKTKAAIAGTRFLPATHMFVTPTRLEWLEQQMDTTGRPVIVPSVNGPFNAVQVASDGSVAEGITGYKFQGMDLYQDFNIPANLGVGSNQDAVILTKADDLYLYESPIVVRALPQTYGNQLTVLLQVYEYMAFTAARYPVSVGTVTGTGLVTPTFNS